MGYRVLMLEPRTARLSKAYMHYVCVLQNDLNESWCLFKSFFVKEQHQQM